MINKCNKINKIIVCASKIINGNYIKKNYTI